MIKMKLVLKTSEFAYVLAHKADFDKQIGKKVVDKRLYDNYYGLLTGLKSNAQVDDLFAF